VRKHVGDGVFVKGFQTQRSEARRVGQKGEVVARVTLTGAHQLRISHEETELARRLEVHPAE
jgi:hypothetical protein